MVISDVIRLIAGGLLALCCCYVGIIIKRHYLEREKFWKTGLEFVTLLGSELAFKKTPFPKVVDIFSYGRKGSFVMVLNEYIKRLQKGESFEKMLGEMDMPHLKKGEKKNILLFFGELGKTALDDQLVLISRCKAEFESNHKKCAEESKRLGGMYFKLLVLIGIAIMVMLA